MNSPAYFEIQVDNPEKAADFYTKVFGWEFFEVKGMSLPYWRIVTEGIQGGLMKRPLPAPVIGSGSNAFMISMEVRNFDGYAAKILENGGVVALPKFAIPGKCRQGYFLDTEGNTFGIFEPNKDAA